MREGDYLASISSSGPSTRVSALLAQPILVSEADPSGDRVESFIIRSGLPISPLCYIGLCAVASFFVFIQSMAIGPVTAVTAGLISVYVTVVFVPIEFFARRMRRAERELPGALRLIGERLLRGYSPDQAITASVQSVRASELREVLQIVQRRLLISASLEGLHDTVVARRGGGVLSGFLAALHYAALHSSHEGGTLCMEFSEILASNVGALRSHTSSLFVSRCAGIFVALLIVLVALHSGFLLAHLEPLSMPFFARDLGAVVVLLSMVAILRVTSLAEWERYGSD